MTLPEHAICSLMIAEIGARNRFGTVGVVAVTGISPDLDTAAKLVSDESFWRLHHAFGHSLLFIVILTAVIAGAASRISELLQFRPIFGWCLLAAFVHCLTDSLYWWGVKPLWPFQSDELRIQDAGIPRPDRACHLAGRSRRALAGSRSLAPGRLRNARCFYCLCVFASRSASTRRRLEIHHRSLDVPPAIRRHFRLVVGESAALGLHAGRKSSLKTHSLFRRQARQNRHPWAGDFLLDFTS